MYNSKYLSTEDVIGFFKTQQIDTKTTEEFWQKAIPAAEEIGFTSERDPKRKMLTIHTPSKDRFMFGGLDAENRTHLGIAMAYAILNTDLHSPNVYPAA